MGGGSLFLNGEEILTLDSYLDKVYPKEIEFVFPSGFHPGEKIGGDWTCVAEDIVMPLGSDAPVLAGEENSDVAGVALRFANPQGVRFTGTYNLKLYEGETVAYTDNSGGTFSKYASPINLHANLSRATKTKLVSIWKRVE